MPAASPVPAPTASAPTPAPASDAVVSAAQVEQLLSRATGLPESAISCPAALPARAGAVETCHATAPAGPVDVLVSVRSVHGDDVGLHYDAGPPGT